MAKLLHIQTPPRGSRSASQAVAEHFIDSYRDTHRCDIIETLNVWQAQLPEFDGATIEAKYAIAHRQPHSPEQVYAWKAVARVADHFKSADKYIVSLPMWNFGIPYKLKQYIDLLVQPGPTFDFTLGEGTRVWLPASRWWQSTRVAAPTLPVPAQKPLTRYQGRSIGRCKLQSGGIGGTILMALK